MRKALYRKYRPKSLTEVVGQSHITDILINSLKAGTISHAYLFTGPRGTGKTSIARILAHEINSFDYELEDDYLDIIEIDAASNTGVDNIRELREKATIAPTKGKYKVYIIDEVHMLSKSAFNALLKTLEEPPEHVIFIMATTDIEKVPITITSRSQVYNFKLADPETMFSHLRHVSDSEKINITDDALKIIVRRGGGSFRDSLSLLDQISTMSDDTITPELINSALGIPADEKLENLLSEYSSSNFDAIVQIIKDLLASNLKPELIAETLIQKIIATPTPTTIELLKHLPSVTSPFAEAKLLLALLPSQPQPTVHPPVATPVVQQSSPTPKPPRPQSVSTPSPAPVSPPAPSGSTDFSWDDFLANVKSDNIAIYSQLSKCKHLFSGKTLTIIPSNKAIKLILDRPSNNELLRRHLNGLDLVIDADSFKKDPTISKISDIMGNIQEVNNNGGEIPF